MTFLQSYQKGVLMKNSLENFSSKYLSLRVITAF